MAAASGAPEAHLGGEPAPRQRSRSVIATGGRSLWSPIQGSRSAAISRPPKPRSGAFVRTWLTPDEQVRVGSTGEPCRARLANLIWAAKESATKARREGLRLDVGRAAVELHWTPSADGEWRPLRVRLGPRGDCDLRLVARGTGLAVRLRERACRPPAGSSEGLSEVGGGGARAAGPRRGVGTGSRPPGLPRDRPRRLSARRADARADPGAACGRRGLAPERLGHRRCQRGASLAAGLRPRRRAERTLAHRPFRSPDAYALAPPLQQPLCRPRRWRGARAEERDLYERAVEGWSGELASRLRPGDVVVLHDPPVAGLLPAARDAGARTVFRCHLGVDEPNAHARRAWDFLRPWVTAADAYVFTRAEYVWEGLDRDRVRIQLPSLDPFSPKNQELGEEVALDPRSGRVDAERLRGRAEVHPLRRLAVSGQRARGDRPGRPDSRSCGGNRPGVGLGASQGPGRAGGGV